MRKAIFSFCIFLLSALFTTLTWAKAPLVVEIETNFKTVKEATMAAKTALMKQKFIPSGTTESGFTATRTTGSKSDYYTADVMSEEKNGKIVLTITLIKSGTGLLKLQKVADELKMELGSSSTGKGSPSMEEQFNKTTPTTAQENPSPEQLQSKCKTFTGMKKGGLAMLISGGILFGTGSIFKLVNSGTSTLYNAGSVMVPVGALLIGGGIPLMIVGSKKSKEYCTVSYVPSIQGIGLVFNL